MLNFILRKQEDKGKRTKEKTSTNVKLEMQTILTSQGIEKSQANNNCVEKGIAIVYMSQSLEKERTLV
jgi:hypothetical protein